MIASGGPRNTPPGTLTRLFFDACQKFDKPDALQVKLDGQYRPISHRELQERVRRTALGLQELHVIEPGERFSAVKGVTRGAHRWIDLVRWPDAEVAIASLKARGFRVFVTLPDAPHSIEDVDVAGPLAVAFGNEHDGVSPAAIAASLRRA